MKTISQFSWFLSSLRTSATTWYENGISVSLNWHAAKWNGWCVMPLISSLIPGVVIWNHLGWNSTRGKIWGKGKKVFSTKLDKEESNPNKSTFYDPHTLPEMMGMEKELKTVEGYYALEKLYRCCPFPREDVQLGYGYYWIHIPLLWQFKSSMPFLKSVYDLSSLTEASIWQENLHPFCTGTSFRLGASLPFLLTEVIFEVLFCGALSYITRCYVFLPDYVWWIKLWPVDGIL